MAWFKTGSVSSLPSTRPPPPQRYQLEANTIELNTTVHGANLPNWKSLAYYFFLINHGLNNQIMNLSLSSIINLHNPRKYALERLHFTAVENLSFIK